VKDVIEQDQNRKNDVQFSLAMFLESMGEDELALSVYKGIISDSSNQSALIRARAVRDSMRIRYSLGDFDVISALNDINLSDPSRADHKIWLYQDVRMVFLVNEKKKGSECALARIKRWVSLFDEPDELKNEVYRWV